MADNRERQGTQIGTEAERERERMMEGSADDLPIRMHHGQLRRNWSLIGAVVLIGLAIPFFYIALSLMSGLVTSWTGFTLAALLLLTAVSVGLGGLYVLLRGAATEPYAAESADTVGEKGAVMKVRDLMTKNAVKCGTLDSITECAKLMYKQNVGYLVVQDEQDKFVGVVTDRDIVCAAVANDVDLNTSTIMTIVEPNFRSIHPEATIDECIALMSEAAVRRLPVIDQTGKLFGVVSVDDLIAKRACTIDAIAPIFERQLAEPHAQRAA